MERPLEPAELIDRAFSRDAAAERALAARLWPVIHARVARVLRRQRFGDAEVKDAVSQVWLRLFEDEWKKLRAFREERGASLEGFVAVIAEREALHWIEASRAQKRGGGVVHSDSDDLEARAGEGPDPEQTSIAADLAKGLEEHLWASLSARGRLILQLLYRDGREVQEVGKMLSVETQVVYNWQHKIRSLAREFLLRSA